MGYKIFLWSFSIFSLSQKDQNIHVVICNCLFSWKNMAKNSHFWWWEKLKLCGQKKWCIWCCAYANCRYVFPLYFGTCNQKPRKMTENPQNWLQCFVHYYVQRRMWYLSKWYTTYFRKLPWIYPSFQWKYVFTSHKKRSKRTWWTSILSPGPIFSESSWKMDLKMVSMVS